MAGLSGVVIGSRPGSSAPGRGARAPRAVLWGQHAGSLIWHSPGQVSLHSQPASMLNCVMGLVGRMLNFFRTLPRLFNSHLSLGSSAAFKAPGYDSEAELGIHMLWEADLPLDFSVDPGTSFIVSCRVHGRCLHR